MKKLQIIEKISFILSGLSLLVAFLIMAYSLLSGISLPELYIIGMNIVYIIEIAILCTVVFFGIGFLLIIVISEIISK